MTSPETENDRLNRSAIEGALRALKDAGVGRGLFLEERFDARLRVGPNASSELSVTRSRGAAAGDDDSSHLSDPNEGQFEALARGELAPATDSRPPDEAGRDRQDQECVFGWMPALGASFTEGAERAVRGLQGHSWSASVIAFHQTVWVVNPDGHVHSDIRRGCRVEGRVQVEGHPYRSSSNEGVIQWGSRSAPSEIIEEALDRVDRKAGTVRTIALGERKAVFAPGVGGVIIHELAGHALEGDGIAGPKTWILGEGLPVPARALRVLDDPRRGRGAWKIDDEGESSRATVLVDAGRPVGLLLDRCSAAALGRSSTGHGRRSSYLTAVRPRMGCTFIDAGEDDPHDVVKQTGTGVFIRRLTAGHTDATKGRASFVVSEADEIVNGRLGSPLAPFIIELDGPAAWRSIDRVGHDLTFDTCVGSCVRDGQPLAVSVGAPTIRIGVTRVVA